MREGLSEKVKRVILGLRIPLCKQLGTFAKPKEIAHDIQGGELKRGKVRVERKKEPDGTKALIRLGFGTRCCVVGNL